MKAEIWLTGNILSPAFDPGVAIVALDDLEGDQLLVLGTVGSSSGGRSGA
jgi:hypothetical protein